MSENTPVIGVPLPILIVNNPKILVVVVCLSE
jgi:hypothetical protein